MIIFIQNPGWDFQVYIVFTLLSIYSIAELYFSVILIWKYDQDDQNPHLFSYDDGDDEVVRGRLLEGSC